MSQLAEFTGSTPRFALPYLFAGQTQKEFFVNEAHALIDLLLQPVIDGESNTPPPAPIEGETWLVDDNPTGLWTDQAGAVAGFIGGNWLFIPPVNGLRVWDRAVNQQLIYRDSWQQPQEPTDVTGGSVVDIELRAAFTQLIEALRISGIFPE